MVLLEYIRIGLFLNTPSIVDRIIQTHHFLELYIANRYTVYTVHAVYVNIYFFIVYFIHKLPQEKGNIIQTPNSKLKTQNSKTLLIFLNE